MDKAIKKHFSKTANSPQEKKLLSKMLSTDKRLDRMIDRDKAKKGK